MSRLLKVGALAVFALTSEVGCENGQPAGNPRLTTSATPPPRMTETPAAIPTASNGSAEAQKIFKSRCIVCHASTGTGDGPGAAALSPKPRNYTDAAWQKTVTDEEIRNAILLGGAAVGKSPSMPSNPDLQGKPEVLDSLVAIVRSFGKSA